MKSYDMPEVSLGDFVYYYAHEDAAANIAIVTEVSSRSIKCWVIVPDYGGVEKFSVHHKDDVGLDEFPEWKRSAKGSKPVTLNLPYCRKKWHFLRRNWQKLSVKRQAGH